MRIADETGAGGMHQGEAEHPEEKGSDHEVKKVLHEDISCILGSCESGLDKGEARLHEKDKHCCEEYPYGIQSTYSIHG